jgi:hypothetical protein
MTTPPRPPKKPVAEAAKPKTKAKARPPRIGRLGHRTEMEEKFVRGRVDRAINERAMIMHQLNATTSEMHSAPSATMNKLIAKKNRLKNALVLSKKGQLYWEDVWKRGYPFPPPPPPPGGAPPPPPPPAGGGAGVFV